MQELECFNCGALNNFGNKFCTSCGEKFQYSCPNCNAIVNPGAKFCSTCAAELTWNITPPSTPVETTYEKQEEIQLPPEVPFSNSIQIGDESQQYERATERYEKTEERISGPRRNLIPLIVIVALLLFFILVIFVSDIFLKF